MISALDVPMLIQADYSFVVVNDKMNRSINDFISKHARLGYGSPRLSQITNLNTNALAQLWHDGLPIQTLESLVTYINNGSINAVIDCASESIRAQLFVTQMRDASLQPLALQDVHFKVGELLAGRLIDEFGVSMDIVETVQLPHVQGNMFKGLSCSHVSNILILPLMRGGEPLAKGIYSSFPSAQFIHFYDQENEIDQRNNLLDKALHSSDTKKPLNVAVVDSVINTGSSIKRAINHIYQVAKVVSPDLEIVLFVLSGVMQQEAAVELPRLYPRVRFVTLRVSDNKFTGKGGSDTGNRLFGTTSLD